MNKVLLHTINKQESISEVYMHLDQEVITEVKYLNNNRVKKYIHSIEKFVSSFDDEELKMKIRQFNLESNPIAKSAQKSSSSKEIEVMDFKNEKMDFIKPLGSKVCPI